MPTRLAAVVMAGGLGTRMRSALAEAPAPDPRAADGRLGRRGRAPARRPTPLVVVASPETAAAFDGVDGRGAGAGRSERATRSARRARRSGTRTRSSSSRVTRRSSRRRSSPGSLRLPTEAPDAAATVLSFVPDESAATAGSSADDDGALVVDRRGRRRDARSSSRSARRTPRSTCSARVRSGPRSTR